MGDQDRIDIPKKAFEPSLADGLPVEEIDNAIAVLILQHPSEAKEIFGTGRLAARTLKNSRLRIGLSWRSLSQAWGEEVDKEKWAVLYVGGSKLKGNPKKLVSYFSNKGKELGVDPVIEGIVLLDGNWAQAKTYWWKNAWLRKLIRVAIQPKKKSKYNLMRREPRKECLSTIESLAFLLGAIENDDGPAKALGDNFSALVEEFQSQKKPSDPKNAD